MNKYIKMLMLVVVLLFISLFHLKAQEGYSYGDKCAVLIPHKWVANKGLYVKGVSHFLGNFRIKIREKYISIEGKRYYINEVQYEVRYQGSFRRELYKVTYYPPSAYSEKPSDWVICFSGRPDEGWNMTYEATLFKGDGTNVAFYRGTGFHLKKNEYGNPVCENCWPEVFNEF